MPKLHEDPQSHKTQMSKIPLQRAEKIFPALKESTSCTVVPASCNCTCVTSSDDTQEVICIKVEEDQVVGVEVEEFPEPITFLC